jgi:antitoxin (DNA-binding transcriptional repressor) of toxin-antitoxin stability system
MTSAANVHDAKTRFSGLLQRVFDGEELIIGTTIAPAAIPAPLPDQVTRRIPGNDAGKVIITSAFDETSPEFGETCETLFNIESLE